VVFIQKERTGISTNDKFIYNGDFENGKKHGHGEMYWKPINLELFKESAQPGEATDGLIVFQQGHFEFHYSGQWSNDKMNGKGELYIRK
jgi:hypothetical protein